MPSDIEIQCQSIGWTTEKQKRKKLHELLTEVPWISLLHVGVLLACQNLIPNQENSREEEFAL